jgi:hypothetical protein
MDLLFLILDAVLSVLESELTDLGFLWDFLRSLLGLVEA